MKSRPVLLGQFTIVQPGKQRGVVLVIALVVLIVMMLAGMGMMRSVDTGSIVAGNIAFKQATIHGADRAIDDAYALLTQLASLPADKAVLNYSNGHTCQDCPGVSPYLLSTDLMGNSVTYLPGYFSAPEHPCEVRNECTTDADKNWWKDPKYWAKASPPVTETDANGNQVASVSYLIHRMCTMEDVTPNGATNQCQTFDDGGSGGCDGCSKKVGANYFGARSIFYRITARSVGPRNTVAYTQAMVLVGQ